MLDYENGYEIMYYLGVFLKHTEKYNFVETCRFNRRAVGADRIEQVYIWMHYRPSKMQPTLTVDVAGLEGWDAAQKVIHEIDKYVEEENKK